MSKIFRFDCYPHDWLLDTSRLTPEDRGIYVQIVMLIYARGGHIDNDPKWISGSCNCSSRLVSASISRLVEMDFIQLSAGKITQKRVQRELNTKRAQIESGANGGRKTAENKPETSKDNGITPRIETSDPPSSNPTPNPIPNPISNPPVSPTESGFSFLDRSRLDPVIPAEWLAVCRGEMGWPENIAMDIWTKFSGHQGRKVGHAALKTSEEWGAEWRTWYRKENIPAQRLKAAAAVETAVPRTPEEQAKYDAEQRSWHLKMGKQHPVYNPEGKTVLEANT
ncbi:MAG TPA: DUF1376 domain-containing protein [Bryobacteraceae bacterium]|jgi:uncharacterized protein YdaU (DUF1376 family)|nr:DUF1376 domain-containing protein [Bryobacteraceae bacterium]